MLAAAIKDMLVERRRIAVSLDTEIRVEEVRGLVFKLFEGQPAQSTVTSAGQL